MERMISGEKGLSPGFCCFGIVDECMFQCRMCFKWKEDLKVKQHVRLDKEYWMKAVDGLKRIVPEPSEFVINFGGGEALLREDVPELVAYASQQGFITNIASNGWLIDEPLAEKIADSGLRSINLSLDSLDPQIHDELRGKEGAHRKVMRAIKNLRKYSDKLEIGICSVIYDKTLTGMINLIKWVNSNPDLNWIVLMAAMQPNNTEPDKNWFQNEYAYLWPKKKIRTQFVIRQIQLMKKMKYKIQNPQHQLNAFARYFWSPEKFVKKGVCNMDRAVHISAQGDMFHCFRHETLGNIQEDDLSELWFSEKAKRSRNEVRECRNNCHFLLNCYFEKEYPF